MSVSVMIGAIGAIGVQLKAGKYDLKCILVTVDLLTQRAPRWLVQILTVHSDSALTQEPLLHALTEVHGPCASKQILSSVLQVRVVVPHTLGSVALGDHFQSRVPFLQGKFKDSRKVRIEIDTCHSMCYWKGCQSRFYQIQLAKQDKHLKWNN